ncbi:MAG: hypothetical protein LBI87_11665, partial [Candidatus Accumulibacter sp.]|nr:hypothetical protein [Accumulibacter sp.]
MTEHLDHACNLWPLPTTANILETPTSRPADPFSEPEPGFSTKGNLTPIEFPRRDKIHNRSHILEAYPENNCKIVLTAINSMTCLYKTTHRSGKGDTFYHSCVESRRRGEKQKSPSFPRKRESRAYLPARSAAFFEFDSRLFGPEITNWIPAHQGDDGFSFAPRFSPLHRKTDSGLKPRPLGRCEGWNPGLEGRGFDRSYLGGVQT